VYRLLIVTDNPAAKNMLSAMTGWEALGFKQPRIFGTAEEAVECMNSRHIDAVAVEASPVLEGFIAYLDEHYPNLPLFQIAPTADEQRAVVREVYSLLTRIRADDTNDQYDDESRMEEQRERWMKKIIGGMVPTAGEMARLHRLYRCREKLDVPCVLARLELPEDNQFMEQRWHYGSERLETALRNFFGREHDHMLMHIAVVSTEEVRVLCYPTVPEMGVSENAVFEYVQETTEQIDHYLGLSMHVLDVCRVSGLAAFAAENDAQ